MFCSLLILVIIGAVAVLLGMQELCVCIWFFHLHFGNKLKLWSAYIRLLYERHRSVRHVIGEEEGTVVIQVQTFVTHLSLLHPWFIQSLFCKFFCFKIQVVSMSCFLSFRQLLDHSAPSLLICGFSCGVGCDQSSFFVLYSFCELH